MTKIVDGISRTFSEFLLIPSLTKKENITSNVSLKTPLIRFKKGEESPITINIPMVSAIMQSVSDDKLAIALAREGGVSFIFSSQSIENESEMVRKVKKYKVGFAVNDFYLTKNTIIGDIVNLEAKYNTIAITSDGTEKGEFLGLVINLNNIVSSSENKNDLLREKIETIMTPISELLCVKNDISLEEAYSVLLNKNSKLLAILDDKNRLKYLFFKKKDLNSYKCGKELLDKNGRFLVGAGINTHDYEQRVPALIEAGADVLCIDSSDGFSEWQEETIKWIKQRYKNIFVGAGNVIDGDGFRFLANAGADFIKVGIGGGSICITRETKGIGRGQATAIIEVCKERDKYFEETGIYIPICSDGGIVVDHHITLALAMGADFVMLGRYFVRFDESPTKKVCFNGNFYKEYWGEGSFRARNWQRYNNNESKFKFAEGVDSCYVPYVGSLSDNVGLTLEKIKSTMCNCGSLNIKELQDKAILTVVSPTSIIEGGAHDIIQKDNIKDTITYDKE